MLLFKFVKISAVFTLAFLLFSACLWQNSGNGTTAPSPLVSDELKSDVPFPTKEPENFQAEIIISAAGNERRTFVARSGPNQRYDFDFDKNTRLTSLQAAGSYLLLPDKRIYAENTDGETLAAENWTDFLRTEWLSEKQNARYEKLEAQDNLTPYRVTLGENNLSEMLIYVDERLGMPVRQEYYSINGEQKTLTFSVELRNVKMPADAGLFAVPPDFKKVGADELRKILRTSRP